jgi:uncharacterized protein (UPF0333 family)
MVRKNSDKYTVKSKAQVSMEYLIIFSIAFAMTLPLIIIYAKQAGNIQADVTYAQVYKVANKIGDHADEVYFAGRPSQRTVTLTFPSGITGVTFNGSLILFNITTSEMSYVLIKETSANVTGEIRPFEGKHVLVFKAERGYVNITDK